MKLKANTDVTNPRVPGNADSVVPDEVDSICRNLKQLDDKLLAVGILELLMTT